MAVIFLRGFHGVGFYAGVVRAATWSPLAHCDIYVPGWGVVHCQPNTGLIRLHQSASGLAQPDDVRYLHVSEADLDDVLQWLERKELGAAYDWAGVIHAGLGIGRADPERWFCSEICAAVLQRIGVYLPLPAATYTPGSLLRAVQDD